MQKTQLWQVAGVLFLAFGLNERLDAQSTSVPFVASFERFARHQEIDPPVAGRLLLTELNCIACHAGIPEDLKPKSGPRLNGAGNRLSHAWIVKFLVAPQKEKPGTTMPDVLAGLPGQDRETAARALAAFVLTQHEPFPGIKGTGARGVPHEFWQHGNVEQGRQLYHRVGCIACHEPDKDYETVETKPTPLDQLLQQLDPDEVKELGLASAARRVPSVPHANLSSKYSRQSLTFFLLDPHKNRPSGRMPNLKLGVVEAADIAAWLLGNNQSAESAEDDNMPEPQIVRSGRRLFGELGCSNCHTVKDVARKGMAKPLAQLEMESPVSCVGPREKGLPHFSLDGLQMAALRAAVADHNGDVSVAEATVAQQLEFQLLKLNCLACHERDGKGGVGRYRRPYFETVGHVDIGDEGRLPPPLTAVGRKLKTEWFNRVLKGTGDLRSHMRIRMPVFLVEQTSSLPGLFVAVDLESGRQPSENEVFQEINQLAESGRLILDTGCVQCHPVRGDALPGVVGIDLEGITSRVHPEWFQDFLLNPGELKSRTRMPTFFPGGKSQNSSILKGDSSRQIAAMWAYLKNVKRLQLPPKIERARSEDYELIPNDRPIVLRSFMEQAGTHAIAVGFPERVHFAFDAEQVRLAQAWRGRFLDAQGTWFVRFAPPAAPLGKEQISLPAGVPFALLTPAEFPEPTFDAREAGYQFRGYRLDKSGVPTFLYRFSRFDIEDRIAPEAGKSLIRHFTITDRTPEKRPDSLWFRGHFGKSLKYHAALSYTNETGLSVTVSKDVGNAGELQNREDGTQWLVPVKVERKATIEVRYRW